MKSLRRVAPEFPPPPYIWLMTMPDVALWAPTCGAARTSSHKINSPDWILMGTISTVGTFDVFTQEFGLPVNDLHSEFLWAPRLARSASGSKGFLCESSFRSVLSGLCFLPGPRNPM